MPRKDEFDIGHPAPDRGRVDLRLLAFGLVGAPLAWAAQLAINSAIPGIVCVGPTGDTVDAAAAVPAVAMAAVNFVTLAVGLVALFVSIRSLRRTRGEEVDRSGGVMQAGEGRTRYLAIWGIWTSILFLLVIATHTISFFWSGLCPL